MSLLDDVSIVVTPNGYKAGELYAVIPVPTEGSEEIPTPDFSSSTGWSFTNSGGSNGWIIDAGRAICDSSAATPYRNLNSTFSLVNGKSYRLIIDILQSADNMKIIVGSTTLTETLPTGTNLNYEYFIPESVHSGGTFSIYAGSSDLQEIDNVSVKEYTSADMDVTRATAATRVDENGLVNYAEVIGDSALTGNNSNFDTGIGSWVGYNGGTLAHSTDKLEVTLLSSQSGARIDTNSLISGGQAGKTFKVRVRIWQGTTTDTSIFVYMGAVQKTINISSTPTYFDLELTPTSTAYLIIYRGGSGDAGTYFIDDVTVKEVTRDNVPRIDYTGGGCPHILAEPQRTNLFIQNDISTWNGFGSYAGNTTAPDGTTIDFVNMEDRRIFPTTTISNSTEYTSSIYLKGNKTADVKLRNAVGLDTVITLSTEWQRFELTATSVSTVTNALLIDARYSQGMGAAGLEIAIYGGQVEQGSYATSYIPTSGSTVTRNQDIFTRDGIGSLIGSEGVLFVEMAALSNDGTNRGMSLNDGTQTNRLLLYFSSASNQISVISTGFTGSITYTLPDETLFNKIAVRYKANDITLWVDGESRGTSITTATIPTFTALKFNSGSASSPFFGKVKQLQVYDTALTDTQLAALTS